ncbi:FKB16D [Auxenochlorella protothecoides x Auxenochlorella symbiontica]
MVGSCSLCKGPTMHIPCRTSSCASEQSTPRLHRSLALSPEFSSQGSAKKLCTSTGPYLGGRDPSRRQAIKHAMAAPAAFLLAQLAAPSSSHAFPGFKKDLTSKRRVKIPESEFKAGPEGLKYYDVSPGKGPEAHEGQRVVVHFDANGRPQQSTSPPHTFPRNRWRGITFITSRQGLGVTGGNPLGFDVGARGAGGTLRGLDLGVRGMRVGGQRKLIVPPSLAYGDRGVGEVPGGATLEIDVELLYIKTSAQGARVKLIEG